MSLDQDQKKYFEKAYLSGEHGWPTEEPTPFVLRALGRIRRLGKKGRSLPDDPPRLLDLGCGEGRHTLAGAEEGYYAVGVDYQPRAIERAKAIARRKNIRTGFRFMVGDAFRLPFGPGSFKAVIDYGCLHHVRIPDTRRYLESVTPLLAPGGYFILSCFSTRFKHHPGERRRRNWLVHRGHYDRFFKKQDFRTIFGRSFDIEAIREEKDGLYVFWHVLMRKK